MIKINQIKLPIEADYSNIIKASADILGIKASDIRRLQILRRSIEARKKERLSYVYNVSLTVSDEDRIRSAFKGNRNLKKFSDSVIFGYRDNEYRFPHKAIGDNKERPVVIGSGPCGLLCAYELAKAGFRPVVLERGERVEERKKTVDNFWNSGELNEESNVQFGEGGAGTFSDGKLNGGKADREGRSMEVLRLFNASGAPKEILYDAMPHVGTDILKTVVRNIREEIISYGGEFRFNTKAESLITENGSVKGVVTSDNEVINSSHVALAIGHSARDTFRMLKDSKVLMEPKPFAVGLRIIHDQELINVSQWGNEYPKELGSAYYKLTYRAKSGRSVYSFCMCPGGYVVNASSEKSRTAVNGMSYSGRASGYANSAIVAAVFPKDYGYGEYTQDVLAGMEFQRKIETAAYDVLSGKIPVTYFGCLADNKNICTEKETLPEAFKGNAGIADINKVLPSELLRDICEAIRFFDTRIKGFASDKTLLCAVESRTSSPVRIVRDDNMQSSIKGLYPCGEGAGYAGGIMSAAVDGIKTAEALAKNMTYMLQ